MSPLYTSLAILILEIIYLSLLVFDNERCILGKSKKMVLLLFLFNSVQAVIIMALVVHYYVKNKKSRQRLMAEEVEMLGLATEAFAAE